MRKLLLLLGLVVVAEGSPSTISGTLYSGDGTTTANGTVTIQWNNFTASDGHYVPAGSKIVVVTSGVFSQALEPGTNSAPHFSYRITYRFGSQPPAQCTWVVGTSNAAIGDVETCPAAATSVPAANISLSQISSGGGSDGQCVVVSSGTLTSSACGAFWTQNVNDIYNSNTGNIGIGATPGNFKLDISKSGSSGTVRFFDQTATTGITNVTIKAGAGQSTNNLLLLQDNSSTYQSGIGADMSFFTGTVAKRRVGFFASIPGLAFSSDSFMLWRSADSLDTGSADTGLSRLAAGVVGVGTGAAGSFAGKIAVSQSTPAASSDACTRGSLWADATYIYGCTTTGVIKRVAWVTF